MIPGGHNTPGYHSLEIRVEPVPGGKGFQPFLLVHDDFGGTRDLLPIGETPAMPTYQDAEELAAVVAWNFIDTFTDLQGQRVALTL